MRAISRFIIKRMIIWKLIMGNWPTRHTCVETRKKVRRTPQKHSFGKDFCFSVFFWVRWITTETGTLQCCTHTVIVMCALNGSAFDFFAFVFLLCFFRSFSSSNLIEWKIFSSQHNYNRLSRFEWLRSQKTENWPLKEQKTTNEIPTI